MEPYYNNPSSLRDFINVLFKHKVKILLFFLATVVTVSIGTLRMAPTYQAGTQILMKLGRENLYVPTTPTTANLNPVVSLNREEQINSAIEILKGRQLAEEVIEELGPTAIYPDLEAGERGFLASFFPVAKDALPPMDSALIRFQKDLGVEAVKKSNVIQVNYKNKDRVMAAAVVNSLINRYLDRHVDVYRNPESYKFFEDQSALLKDKLAGVEDALKVFKEKHDLSSLEEQRSLLLRENSTLRTDLNQTVSQITETENRLEQLRRQLAAVPKTIPQGGQTDHNPYLISSLQAKLTELELKEKELLNKYTDQSRFVQNVRGEIAMVRQTISRHEEKRYETASSGVNTTYQQVEQELLRNEAELMALAAKQKTQSAQVAGYQEQFDRLNRIEVELNQLEREVEVNRQNYRLYLSKFEESRISNAMDTERIANVSLIEPARPPLKPVSPRVMLNLALGVFLGIFGALGLAFFSEYLDDSLENPEQAEKVLQIPVLASIPDFKN